MKEDEEEQHDNRASKVPGQVEVFVCKDGEN